MIVRQKNCVRPESSLWLTDDVQESLDLYVEIFLTDAIEPEATVCDVTHFTSRAGWKYPYVSLLLWNPQTREKITVDDVSILHLTNWLILVRKHVWRRTFLSRCYWPYADGRMFPPPLHPSNTTYRKGTTE